MQRRGRKEGGCIAPSRFRLPASSAPLTHISVAVAVHVYIALTAYAASYTPTHSA